MKVYPWQQPPPPPGNDDLLRNHTVACTITAGIEFLANEMLKVVYMGHRDFSVTYFQAFK